jgi:hypothetical protein
MKYAVKMGSGARCTRFLKDWFRGSKVNKWDTQTHRKHGDYISLLSFLKNKEK